MTPRRKGQSPTVQGAKVRGDIRRGAALAASLASQLSFSVEPEHRFHPVRMWRFDLAELSCKIGIEIEGGAFVSGAHGRGAHFREDAEKYAEAVSMGWKVIRVLPEHIYQGQAAYWITRACGLSVAPWSWTRVPITRGKRKGKLRWVLRREAVAP